ncbi:MAG: DUF5456 family protein [Bacteroidales bacterium]|jgi:hypothetical protein|nr:DUF5456 family protein [Bacteroidales bacterium]
MKTCDISEFKFLIKMGLWPGGDVSGIGYVSRATVTTTSAPMTGLSGYRISSGMTLETDRTSCATGTGYILSIYDPYNGHFTCYAFSVAVRKKETDFMEVMCSGLPKPVQLPHNANGKHPFYHAPKYTAEHTSWRTGYIPKPNTRR